jgi:imidazolonepropionase-like amidohydrolase
VTGAPSMAIRLAALSAALAAGLPAFAGPSGYTLKEARVLSAPDGELTVSPRATVVVQDGKIAAVGEAVPVPKDSEVIELAGRWILPGFIDAHSQLGVRGESDEPASAITEDLRLLDAFDPWDPEIERALEGGVTAVALSPGDRNVVGGAVAVIKLVPQRVPVPAVREAAAIKGSLSRATLGGPYQPRYPTAPSGAVELFGSWLKESAAREGASRSARKGRPAEEPASPEGPAAGPRDGEKLPPVLVRVESRSQAERALALLASAGRGAVLLAGRALDERAIRLLEPRSPVVVGPLDLADPWRLLAAPAALERMRVGFAFAGGGERRAILTSAVLAMRSGLSRAGALAALTDTPAAIYGLRGRLGRIAPGADADLVVWSGDPFTLAARVEMVLIDGAVVYRAAPLPAASKETPAKRPGAREVVE